MSLPPVPVQFLEVVRLEGHAFTPEEVALARDMYLLQVVTITILRMKFVWFTYLTFSPWIILDRCAVVLMKMQLVPVLSLFLHQLMNPLLMKPRCYHQVSVSFHWIQKRLVKQLSLGAVWIFISKALFENGHFQIVVCFGHLFHLKI